MTPREKELFKGLLAGKSITESARDAGYSHEYAGQAGWQALQNIKAKAPTIFERHGLGLETLIEKHIKPVLEATETKVFRVDDKIIYSKPLIAWAPRMAAIRLLAEMMGLIIKEQETPTGQIKVIMINAQNRPPRRPAIDIPSVPGLAPPKEGTNAS